MANNNNVECDATGYRYSAWNVLGHKLASSLLGNTRDENEKLRAEIKEMEKDYV